MSARDETSSGAAVMARAISSASARDVGLTGYRAASCAAGRMSAGGGQEQE
jgi:hypothetical protein